METRLVEECRLHELILNGVRPGDEQNRIVAISTEVAPILEWYNKQLLPEPVEVKVGDQSITKYFIDGSPLEWKVPLSQDVPGTGIQSEWISTRKLGEYATRPDVYWVSAEG